MQTLGSRPQLGSVWSQPVWPLEKMGGKEGEGKEGGRKGGKRGREGGGGCREWGEKGEVMEDGWREARNQRKERGWGK